MTTTNTKVLLSQAMLSAILAMSADALAQPNCANARDARSLTQGAALGASITRGVFESAGAPATPAGLQAFSDALLGGLVAAIPASFPSDFVACRVQGLVAGAAQELGRIQAQELVECRFDGKFYGEFAANLYCGVLERLAVTTAAAMPVRIPKPPAGLCGPDVLGWFGVGFDGVALDHVGSRATCYPFSEGEFYDLYEETVCTDCSSPTDGS